MISKTAVPSPYKPTKKPHKKSKPTKPKNNTRNCWNSHKACPAPNKGISSKPTPASTSKNGKNLQMPAIKVSTWPLIAKQATSTISKAKL